MKYYRAVKVAGGNDDDDNSRHSSLPFSFLKSRLSCSCVCGCVLAVLLCGWWGCVWVCACEVEADPTTYDPRFLVGYPIIKERHHLRDTPPKLESWSRRGERNNMKVRHDSN
jgi:hypothetical protein